MPIYVQGSIVELNLGYRIGSEHGGRHYGIVLNNKDSKNNPVLTVVPLSSKKQFRRLRQTEADLGTEIYDLVKLKTTTVINECNNYIRSISNTEDTNVSMKDLISKIEQAKLCVKRFETMATGSYAICNQITTISKIRISDPIKPISPLYNLTISNASLEKIFAKLKQIYNIYSF